MALVWLAKKCLNRNDELSVGKQARTFWFKKVIFWIPKSSQRAHRIGFLDNVIVKNQKQSSNWCDRLIPINSQIEN